MEKIILIKYGELTSKKANRLKALQKLRILQKLSVLLRQYAPSKLCGQNEAEKLPKQQKRH